MYFIFIVSFTIIKTTEPRWNEGIFVSHRSPTNNYANFLETQSKQEPDEPLEKQTTKGYVISNGQQISNLCLFTESVLYLLRVLPTASASRHILYSEDARLR